MFNLFKRTVDPFQKAQALVKSKQEQLAALQQVEKKQNEKIAELHRKAALAESLGAQLIELKEHIDLKSTELATRANSIEEEEEKLNESLARFDKWLDTL